MRVGALSQGHVDPVLFSVDAPRRTVSMLPMVRVATPGVGTLPTTIFFV